MSESNGNPKDLEFMENHLPSLTGGQYSIVIEHYVEKNKMAEAGKVGSATYKFSVAAPQFSLNPQDVAAVFPPLGSLGDHSNVLPHIQLQRSTLPWERRTSSGESDDPWLVLLVLHEGEFEAEDSTTLTLKDLKASSTGGNGIWWPGVEPDPQLGQSLEDPVNIIDVDADLLQQIFPSSSVRKLLTHVRTSTNPSGASGEQERAVIIGNRLPVANGSSLVHLVSLHGRDLDGEIASAVKAQTEKKTAQKVRLVSLYSWRFTCVSPAHSFKGLLLNLNRNLLMNLVVGQSDLQLLHSGKIPDTLTQAFEQIGRSLHDDPVLSVIKSDKHWLLTDGIHKFHLQLEHSNLAVSQQMPGVLRLPKIENEDAEAYLTRGAVALAHTTRLGNHMVSWYHGPLVPGNLSSPAVDLPIQAADQVLHYNPSIGMLDVSYAAAWELGRLLTLQNKPVAADLYNWKRHHAQAEKLLEAEQHLLHLPLQGPSPWKDLPQTVIDWFQDLSLLRAVPFRYLIPDERMLPAESLRFFQVDPLWIKCLIDGAFSVGRVLTGDHVRDRAHLERLMNLSPSAPACGLILRSAVVSGWPDLLIDGQRASGAAATRVRKEKLSSNVLLCLFQELVTTVNIHLKPEALHFGLEKAGDDFQRTLRNQAGDRFQKDLVSPVTLQVPQGAVDWMALKTHIENHKADILKPQETGVTSSVIAFQMIEEVEQVQFSVGA